MSLFPSPTLKMLEIVKGDSVTYRLPFTQDGVAYDLSTVAGIWFTLKNSTGDADAAAVVQLSLGAGIEVYDAEAGEANADFTYTQTNLLAVGRVYLYDVQIKTAAGQLFTALSGRMIARSPMTLAV